MRTSLDAYIDRLRKSLETRVDSNADFDFPIYLTQVCVEGPYYLTNAARLGVTAAFQVELRYFRDIHPFVEPEAFEAPAIAVTVTPETVDIFRNDDVNVSVRTVAEQDIGVARAAYVDLPHHSFRVGENMQIREVLAAPETDGGLRITAGIGLRGSNKTRHFSWLAGDVAVTGGTKVESSTKETVTHLALGLDMTEYDEPIEHLLGGRASKIRKLLREIERVLFLAVAQYRSIVDTDEDGALVEEPYVGLADPRRQTGNRKQTARANSFFRIKRLPHLRGVTIMIDGCARQRVASDRDDGARRKLVEVRPFYRMQPYGPKRSLRRLIWIPAHTRWVRDDGRVEMLALPRPAPAIVPELDDLLGFPATDRDIGDVAADHQWEEFV